ncbi:TATA-box-binding protein-like [Paramacrobiotus metropolitanus]|uniref:TATA-box-binding protein-like n=1 Tax=Paramacrobiotus metropolitanus TaxID=2943436 RepID=UPI00244653EE|nr:TATA-box-binding protein-like [Paramacrobiotus metropolitanus]
MIHHFITVVVFDCKFDLQKIASSTKCTSVKDFKALNLTSYDGSYCQVFSSGKAIINGGTSEKEVRTLLKRYRFRLTHLGYTANVVSKRTANIMATYDHQHPINLYKFAKAQKLYYEPELFDAAKMRYADLGITVKVFSSGKCTILGAKSVKAVDICIDRLRATLPSNPPPIHYRSLTSRYFVVLFCVAVLWLFFFTVLILACNMDTPAAASDGQRRSPRIQEIAARTSPSAPSASITAATAPSTATPANAERPSSASTGNGSPASSAAAPVAPPSSSEPIAGASGVQLCMINKRHQGDVRPRPTDQKTA